MVLTAQYYVFLAIWAGSSPPHVVRNIAALLPFWLLYALLLVNAGVCLFNRLPALRRDLSRRPRLTERPAEWVIDTPSVTRAGEARAWLRRLGYRGVDTDEGLIGGVRRRWSVLGTFLFHGAFFLVAAGFLATFVARSEATLRVAVGEEYAGEPGQLVSLSPPRIVAAGAPDFRFKVDRISPEFWRDQLLFTRLEAELELAGGRLATTRINRPLWIGPGTFLRLSGFGYAPLYELLAHDGRTLDGAFVKLDVFPPGRRDFFNLPGYPHRVYLEVLPDLDDEAGGDVTRSLDLVRPAVDLQVMRGRVDLGRALLRQGQGYEFEGMTLHFPEIRYWGEFSVVRDPGAPILFLGYLVGLIGLLLRLGGKRAEMAWVPGKDGDPGTLKGWGDCTPPVPSDRR
jgi:hypothetical protein